MTDLDTLCQTLQSLWHEQIPLSKAMDMRLISFEDNIMTTKSSLPPNVNVHGTAFAGSLYAIQALTGWGMMYAQLKLNGIDASIVIANGSIDYHKPVKQDIVASCDFGEHVEQMQTLQNTGKARFDLKCSVITNSDVIASEFKGNYAVRLNRPRA